jgi:hypothetical protein
VVGLTHSYLTHTLSLLWWLGCPPAHLSCLKQRYLLSLSLIVVGEEEEEVVVVVGGDTQLPHAHSLCCAVGSGGWAVLLLTCLV